jgi:ATP-binding protein involved in chromosome partitioning
MNLFDKIELPDVRRILAVASGKGGVGKSTVAANLAVALSRQGLNIALVDADIFGPSIPKMFGLESARPTMTTVEEKNMMVPVEKYGIKIMSIGFLVDSGKGLIWRGPMAAKAITQVFEDTLWGEIDYMIIDFPPGTSDIQLTTVQKLVVTGALIVTTPQELSICDARKAASMFTNDDLKTPILGVVENMSWFSPANHPDEKYFIFGQGGGERLAKEYNTRLLGQIPLVAEVGEAADKGLSIYSQGNKAVVKAFDKMVEQLVNS